DLPKEHRIYKGRVLTCVGDEVIENGFVETDAGKIMAVGCAADLGSDAADLIETTGTILPGLFNNHAHLAWDGIHDLARQSLDDTRRAVRDQVRAGADLIKIMACHDTLEFTDEELRAVVDESHRNGLPITAHATFDACINRVVKFGIDTVEHGGAMSDETIQLL